VLLGGCVESAADDPSDNTTADPDSEQMDSDGPVPPAERQELVDQLPEPSPLSGSLVDLVAASDREATADELGYEFRTGSHAVRVQITLESGAEMPEGYRVSTEGSYGGTVDAYVHVDDLVPLAMEDGVRIIRPPDEPRPHDSL
jgi:hypothetical protein